MKKKAKLSREQRKRIIDYNRGFRDGYLLAIELYEW